VLGEKKTIGIENASSERFNAHANLPEWIVPWPLRRDKRELSDASLRRLQRQFARYSSAQSTGNPNCRCAFNVFWQLHGPRPSLFNAMKLMRLIFWPVAAFSIASLVVLAAEDPDPREVEIAVGRLLEQGHYSRKRLDDNVSRQLLKNYLEALDYNHLFFTQKDVEGFAGKYGTSLDEAISQGFPEPAFTIYDTYKKRVEDRIVKVRELLAKPYDFKSDRTIEVNRQKAAWPKDDADADRIWRDRVEGEFLQETLNTHKIDPPLKVLTRRYDQVLRNLHEQNRDDVMKMFLSVLAQTYDPHSEYLSRSELEN
jgi:hypothetical protein